MPSKWKRQERKLLQWMKLFTNGWDISENCNVFELSSCEIICYLTKWVDSDINIVAWNNKSMKSSSSSFAQTSMPASYKCGHIYLWCSRHCVGWLSSGQVLYLSGMFSWHLWKIYRVASGSLLQPHRSVVAIFNLYFRWCLSLQCSIIIWKFSMWLFPEIL